MSAFGQEPQVTRVCSNVSAGLGLLTLPSVTGVVLPVGVPALVLAKLLQVNAMG